MSRRVSFQQQSLDHSSRSTLSHGPPPNVYNTSVSNIKTTNLYASHPDVLRNTGRVDSRGNALNPSQVVSNSLQREHSPSQHSFYHVQSQHHSLSIPLPQSYSSSGRFPMPTSQPGFHSRQRQDEIRHASQFRSPMYQPNDFLSSTSLNNAPFDTRGVGNWSSHTNSSLMREFYEDFGQSGSSGDSMWNEGSGMPMIQLSPSEAQQWDDMNALWPSGDSAATSPSILTTSSRRTSSLDAPPFAISPLSTSSSPGSSMRPSHSSRNSSPLSTVDSTSSPSRSGSPPSAVSPTTSDCAKICSHCRATSTPLWRRDPQTLKQLCNACGLYLQQRHKLRPQELIDADEEGDTEEELPPDWNGPECSHCHTHTTSVWRRSKEGAQLCNACGVYKRLRGKDRPLTLKKNKIKPRLKHNST